MMGTAVEAYDFTLYGTMTALVFDQLFFPGNDPAAATLAAFGTLAAGYVARPVGGILFGHFGDRLGRKRTLVVTLMLMGVASFLIGVLPTYEMIGDAAPALLVLLRVAQGMAFGGEWAGAVLMVAEHADANARGRWNAVAQVGGPIGALLSTAVVTGLTPLPKEALLSWAWRVPFLLSAVLLIIGLYVRFGVTESPVFERAAQDSEPNRARFPLTSLLRRPRTVLLTCAVGIGPYALTAMVLIYLISYTKKIGYPVHIVMTSQLLAVTTGLVAIPFFSALSDRIGRKATVLIGAVGIVVYAFPFFALVDSLSTPKLYVAVFIAQILQAAMFGPLGVLLAESFDTVVRYTGVSLGCQLASVIGAGFTPLIASHLMTDEMRSTPLALLIIGAALVTVAAVTRLGDHRGRDLNTPV